MKKIYVVGLVLISVMQGVNAMRTVDLRVFEGQNSCNVSVSQDAAKRFPVLRGMLIYFNDQKVLHTIDLGNGNLGRMLIQEYFNRCVNSDEEVNFLSTPGFSLKNAERLNLLLQQLGGHRVERIGAYSDGKHDTNSSKLSLVAGARKKGMPYVQVNKEEFISKCPVLQIADPNLPKIQNVYEFPGVTNAATLLFVARYISALPKEKLSDDNKEKLEHLMTITPLSTKLEAYRALSFLQDTTTLAGYSWLNKICWVKSKISQHGLKLLGGFVVLGLGLIVYLQDKINVCR